MLPSSWLRTRTIHRALRPAVAGVLLATAAALAQAPGDVRIALVIGNAAYTGGAALANPANDARAMAETLRQLGFSVVELRDGNKTQMAQAVAQVREKLKGQQGVGMLYYAGHGLQLNWHNYMVPVDARLASPADVPGQTIDIDSVIDAFKGAGNRMNILVLDACRNNPFADKASGKGLAQVDAPPGTFLAYATAPGNVAEDGDEKSGNGLYTQFLLQELKKPTAKIEDVFKRVRLNVRRASEGRQIPWESTSLEDDFYFNARAPREAAKPDGQALETTFNQEKADWDRIKDSQQADAFYAFLARYPNGFISEQAQFKLERLHKAKIEIQQDRGGIQALASGKNRYAIGDEFVEELTNGFTQEKRLVKRRVIKADDETAEFSNGMVVTQMGAIVKNQFGLKDPPILQAPADIAVGKRWRSAFTNFRSDGAQENNYYDHKVVALEDVQALGGTVKAYRVEALGGSSSAPGLTLTVKLWIDPRTMHTVRAERLFRNNGRIIEWASAVTKEYRPAPR